MFTFPFTLFASASASRTIGGNATASSAGSATWSMGTLSIGLADATRYVVVVVQATDGAGGTTVSGVTIGGNAATIHVQRAGTSAPVSMISAIAGLAVAAGTTAAIVVTTPASVNRMEVAIYALYNLSSNTPFGTGSNGGLASALSCTCNVPSGGIQIGTSGIIANETVSWTNITKDGQQLVVSSTQTWASNQGVAAATGKTFTATGTSAVNPRSIAVATWG